MKFYKNPFLSSLSCQNYIPKLQPSHWGNWGGPIAVMRRRRKSELEVCRFFLTEARRQKRTPQRRPWRQDESSATGATPCCARNRKTWSETLELPCFDSLSPFIQLRNWDHHHARLVETKLLPPVSLKPWPESPKPIGALWASPLRFSLLMLRLSDPWPPMCSPCWGGQDGTISASWNCRKKEVRWWCRGRAVEERRSNSHEINGQI